MMVHQVHSCSKIESKDKQRILVSGSTHVLVIDLPDDLN